jgi:hypothetical protein
MKKLVLFMLLLYAGMTTVCAQNFLYFVHPDFNSNLVKSYSQGSVTAINRTFDLSADAISAWGPSIGNTGPNDIISSNNKIFVSYCNGFKGGVLIYDYFSLGHPGAPHPVVLKPQNVGQDPAMGVASIGMVIDPGNGDLYVGTQYIDTLIVNRVKVPGNTDAGIYKFTASSNYQDCTLFASFLNTQSTGTSCANLAFDSKGNLWSSTFTTGANFAPNNYLICYKRGVNGQLDKNNYYKIGNMATPSYQARDVNGALTNGLYLLSAPEGIIFDLAGNLWIANNNDAGSQAADNPDGTLVKVKASWINTLLNTPTSVTAQFIPVSQTDIKYIPGGKLGGLAFFGNVLYINDQGNGYVYKWDTSTSFNHANYKQSEINASYPGNGGGCFVRLPMQVNIPAKNYLPNLH